MALSTDEENKVREIIEAFTNGKRLSDLPDVSGNNPFKLLCEVLEDGESKKAALAAMLPYMEENCMYGIEYDVTVSSLTLPVSVICHFINPCPYTTA